jgi:ketosteroid isomerase-like protein
MDMGIKGAKLETVDLQVYPGSAWEAGNYTLTGVKGEVMDRGKYIVVWKDEGGKWKLHRDIWNSSLPSPSK